MKAERAELVMAARRDLARSNLADFACLVDIPTVPLSDEAEEDRFSVMRLDRGLARHHALLCERLQDLERGAIPNLMVLMPPGAAKSTYADVVFVPWFMGRRGRRSVILASYAAAIAFKQGRRARALAKSPAFERLMGCSLQPGQTAVDTWALTNGSEYMAIGLTGGVTGNRADVGILDDPVSGREDAESETIRNKTWDAYQDDFVSRLKPGAPQVIIQTRWHEDDVAGRILPEGWEGQSGLMHGRDGRVWYVLSLPAVAYRDDDPLNRASGESLWPEWFGRATGDPMDHWRPFQKNHRTWSSLYQQKPAPEDGTYFRRDDLPEWPIVPKSVRIYGTSDYAVTEGRGDFTVHRVWAVDHEDNIYRIDGWRGQTGPDEWIERKLDLIQKHKPLIWFGEAGVIQKAVEPALRRRMRERKIFCRLEWLSSMRDKPTRARGFQARTAMGMVFFEPSADLSEFLAFPAGRHDDEVDAASLIGRALDQVHGGTLKTSPTAAKKDRWDRAFEASEGEGRSWKAL